MWLGSFSCIGRPGSIREPALPARRSKPDTPHGTPIANPSARPLGQDSVPQPEAAQTSVRMVDAIFFEVKRLSPSYAGNPLTAGIPIRAAANAEPGSDAYNTRPRARLRRRGRR